MSTRSKLYFTYNTPCMHPHFDQIEVGKIQEKLEKTIEFIHELATVPFHRESCESLSQKARKVLKEIGIH